MRTDVFAVSVLCVALATTAVAGGRVSAAPKSSKSLKASGPHIPKDGGAVNLTAYSNSDGPTSTVVLTGAIGDYGHAVRIGASGSAARQDDELKLTVTRGSFRSDIVGVEGKLLKTLGKGFPTNSTCSGLATVSEKAPIVSGSGTGAYKGLSGTFRLTIAVNEVESWPTCPKDDTSPYLAQSVFISGPGSVSLK